jgi:hypothetical protein
MASIAVAGVTGLVGRAVVDCAEPRAMAGLPAGHPFCLVTPGSVPWTAP